jgi:hypothetical protein
MKASRTCLALLALLVMALPAAGAALPRARTATGNTVSVNVGAAKVSRPIPAGFLGVSLEYSSVRAYEGVGPSGANPVLAQLIRNLDPGQTPILRIGGDSTDWTWWPTAGLRRGPWVRISLDPSWVSKAQELVATTGAKLILGINLEAGSTALSGLEARQLVAGIGAQHLAALEIGNEPELYSALPWYHATTRIRGTLARVKKFGRPHTYNIADYVAEFDKLAKVLPRAPLAGPSTGRSWLANFGQFISGAHGARIVTYHAYGIDSAGAYFRGRDCLIPSGQPTYPTVPGLLAPVASVGLAQGLAPFTALSHKHGLAFRVDEINAITCAGMPGVSDTFASALWSLDMLFAMAQAGVDGVNIHTWSGSAGRLFSFSDVGSGWSAMVQPEYYGLQMFAQAAPPGSQMLHTTEVGGGTVLAWAVTAPDHSVRVVLVNNSLTQSHSVLVRPPVASATATIEPLSAPAASATTGVTLGCQSFAPQTTNGLLQGTPCLTSLAPSNGRYSVQLPAASAALLTIPAPGAPTTPSGTTTTSGATTPSATTPTKPTPPA